MKLAVAVLGLLQIQLDQVQLTQFHFERVRALFVYLLVERESVHDRSALTHLLWPDMPSEAAAQNLRQALATLRRVLKDNEQPVPFLLVTTKTIQFNPASNYLLDLDRFNQLIQAVNQHNHRRVGACTHCIQRLQEAVDLYQGDFLTHFSIDSEPFESWSLSLRERLHIQFMQAVSELTEYYLRRNLPEKAIPLAQKHLTLDPFSDIGHHQLIQALAAHNQRNAALVHYHRYRKLLYKELGVAPSIRTVEFCNLLANDNWESASIGSMRPLHNLPAEIAPFVGYEKELEFLTDRLASASCRLITIAGPGGSGKTRMAIHAAWREVANFQGGVYFVNLTTIKPEQLLSAINAVLSLTLQGKAERKAQLYKLFTWLRDREVLLILDNFEHMTTQADFLQRLLKAAPHLTILVTSREWIRVRSETVLTLWGLRCPPIDYVNEIEQYSAVKLFMQAARRLVPDFNLATAEDRQAVTQLCHVLGGNPLAIQQAAQWVSVFSPAKIAASSIRSLHFLSGTGQYVPQNQRSLIYALDSSLLRLSHQEQEAVARLTIFEDSFTLDAAQSIAQISPSMLMTLQSKSIIGPAIPYESSQMSGESQPIPVHRYRIPELLRRYSNALWQQQSELAVYLEQTKHSRYYLDLLHSQVEKLAGPKRNEALDVIQVELHNILVAWEWLLNQSLPEQVAQTQYDLVTFFSAKGYHEKIYQIVNQAFEKLAYTPEAERGVAMTKPII